MYTRRFKDQILPEDHKPTSKRARESYDYDGREPRLYVIPAKGQEPCEKHGLAPCPECHKDQEKGESK